MTKQEVIQDIERKFPKQGFLSATQIGQYRADTSRWRVKDVTEGLDFIGTPKKPMYFVGDIAQRIIEISQKNRNRTA